MPISKQSAKNIGLAILLSVSALSFMGVASATAFDAGIPGSWTCSGNCGTLGANQDVTTSPEGGNYGWVSSAGGVTGLGLAGVGGTGTATNGSRLRTSAFSANAGDVLQFYFNYVTSDGSGFADYGWAELLDTSFNDVAHLFTARTNPSGNSVPGFGMPAIEATINPATVNIVAGASNWSPLGVYSGACWSGIGNGCGSTGWVESTFTILAAGDYVLEFGVVNWNDQIYDSGLAFDGITVAGQSIECGQPGQPECPAPEPETLPLLGLGLLALVIGLRRKHA